MEYQNSTGTEENKYSYHENGGNKLFSLVFSLYISLSLGEHIYVV